MTRAAKQNPEKSRYIGIWREILVSGMLWTEQQFMDWLRRTRFEERLDDPDDMLYHQPPQFWTIGALTNDSAGPGLDPPRLRQLRTELNDLLDSVDFGPGVDWAEFRERVLRLARPDVDRIAVTT
jgi:hypothetical protein